MGFSSSPPIKTSKHRGQHFLKDKNIVAKIIAAGELSVKDTVLEVGPGLGVMTRAMLPGVSRLIAIELDPLFVSELRKEFGGEPKIAVVEADILQVDVSSYGLAGGDYKLITNLPYNISSAFLKKFLLLEALPERIVVMLQKEVADKIATHDERLAGASANVLGLMCNLYAACAPVCRVSAGCFSPPPKVDSAVICLKPYTADAFLAKWGIPKSSAEEVIAFAARFFSAPRKKMCGLLPKPQAEKCRAALAALGQSPDARPSTLALPHWVELWKKMR